MQLEFQGLNTQEVNERISKGLQNKASKQNTKTIREIIIENIFSVFNLVIFSIIIFLIYFYLTSKDERLLLDSIGILMIAFINTFLAIFQELKAKRALDKVNLLLKKDICAVRNGIETWIDPSVIVKDDIIKIQRGDQVVVDGTVVFSNHLEIDESLLTGESNPIQKKVDSEILSGSFCLSGNGFYKAEKVGSESFASKITQQAKKYKFDHTPLQKKIDLIVKLLFALAIVLVIAEIIFNKEGFTPDFVRKISTILISLVPQGLVLMATVTFAVGVYRISSLGAIVQKLNAIESFSNVQVVCMDKTGTLTQNKLSIKGINITNERYPEDEMKSIIGTYAHLTSDKNATINAINVYEPLQDYRLSDEFPFSSERKLSMIEMQKGDEKSIFILGAYDILIEKGSSDTKEEIKKIFEEKKLGIYRNVLFGKVINSENLEEVRDNIDSMTIEPLCLISIMDKIRDDVLEAIKLFESNGIKIKILSGDSAKAIQEVVNEIGWNVSDNDLISGSELDILPEDEFEKAVIEKIIFARLKPEHKLRIIKALKKEKIYTAMIGDGVNDLPAIKESDMGIAMEEGSSITKEVADIVLLKNKFSLLPSIFDEGNKIVNSVKSVAKLFLTKNFFVIYITLLSIIFLLEFPLTPRRVSLINIFGIGLPAFIITLKNKDISRTKYFMKDVISFVIISALIIVSAGYLGIYAAQKFYTVSERETQMIMLTIMIITNIANYFSIVINKDENEKLIYLLYGFMILIIYIFFTATNIDSGIIRIIKEFYEIDHIPKNLWALILTLSTISSFILFTIQKLRIKIISRT